MGEEFAASTPFFFFCDFGPDLAQAVTQGRRREFTRFERFRDPAAQKLIPDPNDPATFERSRLDWQELRLAPHDEWLAFYQQCLHLRSKHLVPRLAGMVPSGTSAVEREEVLLAHWMLGDGSALHLIANFGATRPHPVEQPPGKIIYATHGPRGDRQEYILEPYSVLCTLA